MSLVGPRPSPFWQVRRYDARQYGRLSVLPGLTGLAQVKGRNRISWPEKIDWDLRYIRAAESSAGPEIIVRTFWTGMRGEGVTYYEGADPIAQVGEDIR